MPAHSFEENEVPIVGFVLRFGTQIETTRHVIDSSLLGGKSDFFTYDLASFRLRAHARS